MASGKYNYFRHHNGARNDETITEAIKLFGVKAYFFWFALIELCSEQSENGLKTEYEFHTSRLYKELRCNKTTLILLLDHFHSRMKLEYIHNDSRISLRIANLSKYLGSYSKKVPNKIKENKIKENKIKKNKTLLEKVEPEFALVTTPVEIIDKPKDNKTKEFIKIYCDKFKQRYGMNPVIGGKQAGIARRLGKELSVERYDELLSGYFSMPDSWLVKSKHPIEAFESKKNEIVVWLEKRTYTTNTQARQKDTMTSNAMLLAQIEAGEI